MTVTAAETPTIKALLAAVSRDRLIAALKETPNFTQAARRLKVSCFQLSDLMTAHKVRVGIDIPARQRGTFDESRERARKSVPALRERFPREAVIDACRTGRTIKAAARLVGINHISFRLLLESYGLLGGKGHPIRHLLPPVGDESPGRGVA